MNLLQQCLSSPWFTPVVTGLVVLALAPLVIGYLSLVERKVLADLQARYGPMRVGPHGLLQPVADALKFLLKEDIIPSQADRAVFLAAPLLSVFAALLGFTVLPGSRTIFISNVNIGLLVVVSVSSLGVLGIIFGGWASNSHYPILGALRSAAQLVSYEVSLGLALLAGITVAGTLNLQDIVEEQRAHHLWFLFSNYGAMILPFVVYVIASIAESNRLPFDLPEAESELVAGYHTEFSGFRWALYMLAEWANVLVLSAVAVTLFLGGWLRPFANSEWLEIPLNLIFPLLSFAGLAIYCIVLARKVRFRYEAVLLLAVAAIVLLAGLVFLIPASRVEFAGLFWFFFKLTIFVYLVIWLRGTFPRVRYDQLMNFGWKWLIPVALLGIAVNAALGLL